MQLIACTEQHLFEAVHVQESDRYRLKLRLPKPRRVLSHPLKTCGTTYMLMDLVPSYVL